jgi:hypothetical protein
VSEALLEDLPGEYAIAAGVVRRALEQDAFTGWTLWPVAEAAVTLALQSETVEDFDDCLRLLSELTSRCTGEFAIRRLLAARPDSALRIILDWTNHSDEHVCRLASEGTRRPTAPNPTHPQMTH